MAMDSSILPGVIAGAAGLGISVGALWWTEQRAVSSIEKLSEDQMTKLAAKMDGGDAENKFSGSDQNLDSLIAGMETAQVLPVAGCRADTGRKSFLRRISDLIFSPRSFF
jgi:hypothetical protein